MTKIHPYLSLNGKCREAMTFYRDCIGGELQLMTVGETPVCDQMPPESTDQIMHSSLTKDGFVLMATDMTGPGESVSVNNAVCLDMSSEEEARSVFAKLSEGGNVTCPLGDAFWGGLFGSFVDKFGTNWLINHTRAQA